MSDTRSKTLRVGELVGAIRASIESLFPYEVWVEGEIADLSRSSAGHAYFTLIEPDELGSPPVAALSVVLFAGDRRSVNALLRRSGGVRMTDGMQVKVRGRVDVYERRGRLQLRMTSIDPTYTLGRLAEERDRVLATLKAERLTERNPALPAPVVPLHIGLVTAKGSAASADFLHELDASGYGFHVDQVDARVQGVDSEQSLVAAVRAVIAQDVDVVAVVRGGGAKTDLASFDSEDLARTIATSPVPVHTGIGHEIDVSVCDLVAHRSHKTPTACAAALVETVRTFLRRVDSAATEIPRSAERRLQLATTRLDASADAIPRATARVIARETERLDARAVTVRAHDPRRTLARGWCITRTTDGKVVRSVAQIAVGDLLHTTFVDGEASAQTTDVSARTGGNQHHE